MRFWRIQMLKLDIWYAKRHRKFTEKNIQKAKDEGKIKDAEFLQELQDKFNQDNALLDKRLQDLYDGKPDVNYLEIKKQKSDKIWNEKNCYECKHCNLIFRFDELFPHLKLLGLVKRKFDWDNMSYFEYPIESLNPKHIVEVKQ